MGENLLSSILTELEHAYLLPTLVYNKHIYTSEKEKNRLRFEDTQNWENEIEKV